MPPERVWESLASDASLSAWGPGVQSLTWTSPRPFGVGTTRKVVSPLKAVTVHEHFFRWDEGTRCSFYVYEANRPIVRRMAEDYVVEADGSGSLLTLTIAVDLAPRLAPLAKLFSAANTLAFGQVARSAKGYFAKHP